MKKSEEKIRVLVVDDSFIMRKFISDILNCDPKIKVIGTAKNGYEAIEKAKELNPDVITMDYIMPKIDGAKTTKKILKSSNPKPSIILLSGYTKKNSSAYEESMKAGAISCVLKPSGSISLDIKKIKKQLIQEVKNTAKANVKQIQIVKTKKVPKKEIVHDTTSKIIVIGASTGGPPLIEKILNQIPHSLKCSILIVQHMPANFITNFAKRLNERCYLEVQEAKEGEEIKTGKVFIAPGDYHMRLKKDKDKNFFIHLSKTPAVNGHRPSIDETFISSAYFFKENTTGILLTGMGTDGVKGMATIKDLRGHTIAQEPTTCIIDSMPKSIIQKGAVDEILTIDEIIKHINNNSDK